MEGITTKKGNQLYVEFQVFDKDGNLLDINGVSKVQFNIGELTKTYDGVSEEVRKIAFYSYRIGLLLGFNMGLDAKMHFKNKK